MVAHDFLSVSIVAAACSSKDLIVPTVSESQKLIDTTALKTVPTLDLNLSAHEEESQFSSSARSVQAVVEATLIPLNLVVTIPYSACIVVDLFSLTTVSSLAVRVSSLADSFVLLDEAFGVSSSVDSSAPLAEAVGAASPVDPSTPAMGVPPLETNATSEVLSPFHLQLL